MDKVAQVKYTIIKQIGFDSSGQRRGLNSNVFLAHDPLLGGEVAIKEINKSDFPDPNEYFNEAHRMFEVHSENVVPVQYMAERDDKVCLAMRYFKKGSLADRIEFGPIGLSETIRIGIGMLKGLGRIHPNTFHFDIKPSNILFSDTDVPMLADFGQARSVKSDGTVELPRMYRFAVPPEWFETSVGTSRSDIYQVGLTLYRAVNGDPFFQDLIPADHEFKEKMLRGKFPPRDAFLPHVPKRIRTIIRTALSVDPLKRYATAHTFQNALAIPLKHDWKVSVSNPDEMTWNSSSPGKATITVSMKRGNPHWRIEAYKQGNKKRKFGEGTLWRQVSSREEAFTHLKNVFDQL